MATSFQGVKTAEVANNIGSNTNLTTVNTNQSVTSTGSTGAVQGTRALTGRQYDKVNATMNKGSESAPVPGEKAATKSGGGDDFFSGIARVVTSAVNVAMAVVNPLSAVANAADTIAKATNKKA